MISSYDIAEKKFGKSNFGGYKNEDVDAFLDLLTKEFADLEAENKRLAATVESQNKKLEVLADKLEEYRKDEESLQDALLSAQKLGNSIIKDSKNKADIILRDANVKAERIVESAHNQVEKERLLYAKMQKDVASFKNKLLAIYKQHLAIISNLPGEIEKEYTKDQAKQEADLESEEAVVAEAATDVAAPSAQTDSNTSTKASEDITNTDVGDLDEPSTPSKKKFIPVTPEDALELDEEEFSPETTVTPPKKNRFGPLKFGAGYDLKRE